MSLPRLLAAVALCATTVFAASVQAKTLRFSGYDWTVRPAGTGGPGPNEWSPDNVWIDGTGALHLKLAKRNGVWTCAELYTNKPLGYGRYQFWLMGRVDALDPNVVFGLFGYPTPALGPDGTHEMDIEFARWGNPFNNPVNYTVWPNVLGVPVPTVAYPMSMSGTYSTHRYNWTSKSVVFQSMHGHTNTNSNLFATWTYKPADFGNYISQSPQPLHINLWNFRGIPPTDGKEVELVVKKFTFTPG